MRLIITGTQAYGPVREESDIDIVMTEKEADELEGELKDLHIFPYKSVAQGRYGYAGFYFDIGSLKVNVIIADSYKDIWAEATREMMKLEPIGNRDQRIATFQRFFHQAAVKAGMEYEIKSRET